MKQVAFDVETTGLDIYRGDRIFSFATFKRSKASVFRFDRQRKKENIRHLRELLRDPSVSLVGHNLLFDFGACRQSGFEVEDWRAFEDTFLLSNLLDNNRRSHALDEICWELGGYPKEIDKKVKRTASKVGGYQAVPVQLMNLYQSLDVERAMALWVLWKENLKDKALADNYRVEKDMVWIALAMMERGVFLRVKDTVELISSLKIQMSRALGRMTKVAGTDFNPGSSAKVAKVLYEDLGLPIIKRKKETGFPSTEKEVLFSLYEQTGNKFLRELAKFRSYSHGIKSLEGYLDKRDSGDIIHPNIRPCGATTGRQSISEPALMGVSKETSRLNPFPVPARRCFGPRPGFVWFSIDYSGIQALLLVGRSGDKRARAIFERGGSMHDEAAKIFYGAKYIKEKNPKKKKELYNAAKNANFAKPFGASREKIKRTLGISEDGPVLDYEEAFPDYCAINGRLLREAAETGQIITTHGRVLKMLKRDAYMAANYFAQGEEAAIMKRAEIRVHDYLQEATGGEAKLVLPIHDEIVIEYPEDRLDDAREIVKGVADRMTAFPEIGVPLRVEASIIRQRWSDKEDFKFND